ncbi:MAG: 2-oxoglutarate dehydrogenase, E2 component, dihydrolipoamide succinyltransferase [Micrococcales bacterium]|nr:MAG: 2-oxoglutarate dehydrogenase, E2 component, dihydrolipoamide succinyltransferase [Micrococcales bacterium]
MDAQPTDSGSDDSAPDSPAAADAGSVGQTGGGGTPVRMPALGESVTEGTVTRWLKSVGDTVEVDEPLLEVSTDKVDTEVPSPVAGTLTKILVDEDETVEVGADLCLVGDGSQVAGDQPADQTPAREQAPAPAPVAEAAPQQQVPQQQAVTRETGEAQPAPVQPAPQAPTREAPQQDSPKDEKPAQQDSGTAPSAGYITPLVRKLAKEHNVDLAGLTGTGVGGRIRKQDVLEAANARKAAETPATKTAPAGPGAVSAPAGGAPAAPTTVPEPSSKRGSTEKMSRLRKIIAERMVESLQTSAQLTSVLEVDITRIAALRARVKDEFYQREGETLSFMPFFALALCETLKAYPMLNAQVDGDSVVYHDAEHLGIAVDTPRGLLVPVVRDAGDLNIAGLNRRIADLAARTRDNKVGPDELSGGTFTLTNTGSRGALFDTPIINQPQVGILGTGAMVRKPMVVSDSDGNETVGIRTTMHLALSYDHRIVDGADAARFLSAMKARLEEGAFEV